MIDIKEIIKRLNIERLNNMQTNAIKSFRETTKDIILLSPTGSGKTFAYLLPLLEKIDVDCQEVQALVVVPGRELALQLVTVFQDMKCGISAISVYGGRPAMDENRVIKQVSPQIIFGTPGRLNDHIAKNNISTEKIRYVVLDEFDKCLEMGFQDEMRQLLDHLQNVNRRILVSATPSDAIPKFINLSSAICIDYLSNSKQLSERISLNIVRSTEKDKLECLIRLLRYFRDKSTIVFLNYRDSVERVSNALKLEGFTVSVFHGGLNQDQRESELYRFYNASANILVATDLASRGLDIPNIDNIVHYHLPLNEEAYIHRVGRATRWMKSGNTYFILNQTEHVPEYIKLEPLIFDIPDNLPSPMSPKMITLYIGKGKKDKISKGDIVGFLCKKGGLTSNMIGRIDVKERYTYVAVERKVVRNLLKIIQGEKIKGIKTIVEIIK